MASKKVLKLAIQQLQIKNKNLQEKKKNAISKAEKMQIDKQIASNNSMILDYEFRYEQEND